MDEKAGPGQANTMSRVQEDCQIMVEKLRLRPQKVPIARGARKKVDREEVLEVAKGERKIQFKIMRTIWRKAEDAEQQRNIGTGSTSQANQDHRRFEDSSRRRRV